LSAVGPCPDGGVGIELDWLSFGMVMRLLCCGPKNTKKIISYL
jgi:hypothetical protein